MSVLRLARERSRGRERVADSCGVFCRKTYGRGYSEYRYIPQTFVVFGDMRYDPSLSVANLSLTTEMDIDLYNGAQVACFHILADTALMPEISRFNT